MIWIKNVDEFIKHEEWVFKETLKAYRERVMEYYKDEFQQDNNSFPFMSPVKLVAVFRDYDINLFYLHSSSNEDEFISRVDGFNTIEEYDALKNLPEHIQEARLLEIAGIRNYIEKKLSWYGETDEPTPSYYLDGAKYCGRNLADKHFQEIKRIGYSLTSIDVRRYLSMLNDEQQFKYEIEEALKAYDHKLYLASTVTAAVSLETLLQLTIVLKLGNSYLPQNSRDKHTLNYAKILLDNGIINERLNHRIRALNELRRASAHSKSGIMTGWDAEQYLIGIFELIAFIFNE